MAQTVTSADGFLTVDVPEGAMSDASVEVAVRALAPSELPEGLEDFEQRGTLYELEPDGTTFSEPVTITRRIDADAVGFDLSAAVPIIALVSRDSAGQWELLGDQSITVEGSMVVAAGTTTHFSTIAAFAGVAEVRMEPSTVVRNVGKGWRSRVAVELLADIDAEDIEITQLVGFQGDPTILSVSESKAGPDSSYFVCKSGGESTFKVLVGLREVLASVVNYSRIRANIAGAGAELTETTVSMPGTAKCVAPAPRTRITGGSVSVTHIPLNVFPSFLRWLFTLGPPENLPENATVELTVEGANNEAAVEAPVQPDGSVELDMGISSFGPKTIKKATLVSPDGTRVNLTKQLRSHFARPEVTADEGCIAGDCP